MTMDTTERLRSLLIDAYGSVQPSEPSHRRVMTAIAHAADHALPVRSAHRPGLAMPAWRRVAASVAAGATLLLPAGASVADTDSLPGDLGYGVRHAVEQLWVGVTWGPADVQARRTVAARRLAEAEALRSLSGSSDQIQALQAEARALLEGIQHDAREQGSDGAQAAEVRAERGAVEQPRGRPAHAGTPPGPAAAAGATGRDTSQDRPAPANADDGPQASSRQTDRPDHAPSDQAAEPQAGHGEASSGAPADDASSGGSAGGGSGSPRPPSGQQGPPPHADRQPATDAAPANGAADQAPVPGQAAAPERPAPPPAPTAAAPAPAPPAPTAASPVAPPAPRTSPAAPAAPAAVGQGGQAEQPGSSAAGGGPGGPPAGPPG